jgi:hypothetical protein
VTDAIMQIVKDQYECIPVEGMLSSQLVRGVLDGDKQIVSNPTPMQRRDFQTQEFSAGEVWSIDVLVSSGEGKAKPSTTRTTIFKRIPDSVYQLKMQTSRRVFSEISRTAGYMPFTINHLSGKPVIA